MKLLNFLIGTSIVAFASPVFAGPTVGPMPIPPVERNCSAIANLVERQNCVSQASAEMQTYERQMLIYQGHKAEAETAAQKAAASGSASGAFTEASDESKEGSALYQGVASIAQSVGTQHLVKAYSCKGTCTAPELTKAAIAFAIMGAATSQSGRMDKTAYAACIAANQTSATQTNCGPPPADDVGNVYDPNNPLYTNPNASCPAGSPPSCIASNAPTPGGAGSKITPTKGPVSFAGPGGKPLISKEGVVTLPNGKTMMASELLSKEGMMKAGLSSADADSFAKQMNLNNVAKTLDAKKDLKDMNSLSDELSVLSGAGGAGGGANGLNGSGAGEKDLKKRDPAAQGLTKDFNGESIGAAGDDIFSMMNRRYKLKTAQDSFIEK